MPESELPNHFADANNWEAGEPPSESHTVVLSPEGLPVFTGQFHNAGTQNTWDWGNPGPKLP